MGLIRGSCDLNLMRFRIVISDKCAIHTNFTKKAMRYIFTLIFPFLALNALAQQTLPFDFETAPSTADFIDFAGGVATVMPNPDPSGINESSMVAQIVRNPGDVWAGSKIVLSDYLDLETIGGFRMKVWVPMVNTVVKLKLEGLGLAELDAITTTTGAWETLVWDFTGLPSGTFNEVVFMPDFGNFGDGSEWSTVYIDDVELFDATYGLAQIDLPIDFEGDEVNYHTTSFAGNFSSLVEDPFDASNTVVRVLKTLQSLDYSGTTISTPAGLANPIPFVPGGTTITAKVWSQVAGTPVRFKAEDRMNGAISVETEAYTTQAGEWETLTFDLSQEVPGTQPLNMTNTYDVITLFFDFGTAGGDVGDQIFYFDDVVFGDVSSQISEDLGASMRMYPNLLANGQPLQLEVTGGQSYSFKLRDGSGRIVLEKQCVGPDVIVLSNLTAGMYHATMECAEGRLRQSLLIH